MQRCAWCGDDPLYVDYHDREWGVPERDGRKLFEMLILEGFQAGLSWITILRKRENFRAAFANFEPSIIAEWGEDEVVALLKDAGIIRHRGKIEATIKNAQAFLEIESKQGFAAFIWDMVPNAPIQNLPKVMGDVPGQTPMSLQISKTLKKNGFKFCGPTTVYAFMQAAGLVNDHMAGCFRQNDIAS